MSWSSDDKNVGEDKTVTFTLESGALIGADADNYELDPDNSDLTALASITPAELTVKGFELADQYRMPAVILADGLLGQMMEPVEFPEISATTVDKSSWAATGHKNSREHHIINSLYLKPDELEKSVIERFQRYEKIKEELHEAELQHRRL